MATLVPPDAYGIVEPEVYRANVLQPSNFAFIATLKLRKVLVLSPETPTKAVSAFFEENRIELPVSEELVKEGLQVVLDPSNYPLLIMCTYATMRRIRLSDAGLLALLNVQQHVSGGLTALAPLFALRMVTLVPFADIGICVVNIVRSGIHQTGTFVGCLRKLQGWSLNSIIVEWCNERTSIAKKLLTVSSRVLVCGTGKNAARSLDGNSIELMLVAKAVI